MFYIVVKEKMTLNCFTGMAGHSVY